jgi:hypothetical protein
MSFDSRLREDNCTFQHTERRPAVICGSLCAETWIFKSVKE